MLTDVARHIEELLIEYRENPSSNTYTDVVMDSKQVVPGSLFVAVPGSRVDGHQFISAALKSGASAVVSERLPDDFPENAAFYLVQNSAKAAARLFQAQYGYPDRNLKLCGITGTNGKTTSAYLLQHLLNASGVSCGRITTISCDDGITESPSNSTTPDSKSFFQFLSRMRDAGLESTAFELSSHGLAQHRTWGIKLHVAILTNITRDHLDYHETVESYINAKKLCFTELLDRKNGIAVINIDDACAARLAEELRTTCRVVTFGRSENAQWQIEEFKSDIDGIAFKLSSPENTIEIKSPLVGLHNAENLAGVLIAAFYCQIPLEKLAEAAALPLPVPGRLEKIKDRTGVSFFIDYAHTDDALHRVLSFLKPLTAGQLTVVFGAGGNRDKTKRPAMGKRAAEAADKLFITSDNPRDEEPQEIISQIISGIPNGVEYQAVPDRRAAIRLAVETALPGDVVAICGKGHEDYQEISGVRYHFSDREELLSILKEIGRI